MVLLEQLTGYIGFFLGYHGGEYEDGCFLGCCTV